MSISILNRGASGGLTANIIVNGLSENDTVYAKRKKPIVIDGYTTLEYIESSGTQHIDTGITPAQGFGFYVDCTPLTNVGTTSASVKVLGSSLQNEGMWGGVMLGTYPTNAGGQFTYFKDGKEQIYDPGFASYTRVQIEAKNGIYTSSTGKNYAIPYVTNGFICGSLYLFNVHDDKGVTTVGTRIYSCRLYDGSIVTRDFVPVKRNSDGVLGMYDIVTDVFYTNAGTGEFIAGREFPHYGDEDEYIDSATKNGKWVDGHHELTGIKDLGLWTVTATNGVNTKTQDVFIEVIGLYEIEMDYKLWLYREGDECEEVTGGWTTNGYSFNGKSFKAPTLNADSIYFNPTSSNDYLGLGTINQIDITAYNTIKVKCKRTSGTYHPTLLGNTTKSMGQSGLYLMFHGGNASANNTVQTMTLDISNKSGYYYIAVEADRGDSGENRMSYVYSVWLE